MWRASVHLYHSSLVWLEQRTEHLALLGVWEWTAQQTSRRVCMLTAVLEHSYEVRSVRTETPPPHHHHYYIAHLGCYPVKNQQSFSQVTACTRMCEWKMTKCKKSQLKETLCVKCVYGAWKTTTNSPKMYFSQISVLLSERFSSFWNENCQWKLNLIFFLKVNVVL